MGLLVVTSSVLKELFHLPGIERCCLRALIAITLLQDQNTCSKLIWSFHPLIPEVVQHCMQNVLVFNRWVLCQRAFKYAVFFPLKYERTCFKILLHTTIKSFFMNYRMAIKSSHSTCIVLKEGGSPSQHSTKEIYRRQKETTIWKQNPINFES